MSFDLYFYKKENSALSREEIGDYLEQKAGLSNKHNADQWLYENKDTSVYCSFDFTNPDEYEEEEEERYEGYENTNFSFNLNFLRPDFFGLEAFSLVDNMTLELDLFVVNPQFGAESDVPHKPVAGRLYTGWSEPNATFCKENFEQFDAFLYPLEQSNAAWSHNYTRNRLQSELGPDYFVPRVFFIKDVSGKNVFTLSTWTEHIPNIFPPTDLICLNKNYKRVFKVVNESGIITYSSFLNSFGAYLDEYGEWNCKIIRPANTEKVKSIFNSIRFEQDLGQFEQIEMDKLFNAKP